MSISYASLKKNILYNNHHHSLESQHIFYNFLLFDFDFYFLLESLTLNFKRSLIHSTKV